MSLITAQSAFHDVIQYSQNFGMPRSSWYAGVARVARDRLFIDHCVDEHAGAWIFRRMQSHTEARAVEQALLQAGFSGGPGGGDASTVFVYAYLITASTRE